MSPRKRPRPSSVDTLSDPSSPLASDPRGASAPDLTASSYREMPPGPRQLETNQDTPPVIPKHIGKQVHRTKSWYGSWPRAPKSVPSTQVATADILGDTIKPTTISDLSRYDIRSTSGSLSRSTSATSLADSLRSAAAHPESGVNKEDERTLNNETDVNDVEEGTSMHVDDEASSIHSESTVTAKEPSGGTTDDSSAASIRAGLEDSQRPATSSSWMQWLGRAAASTPTPKSLYSDERAQKTSSDDHSEDIGGNTAKDENSLGPSGQFPGPAQPSVSEQAHKPPGAVQATPTSARQTFPAVQTTFGSTWLALWQTRTTQARLKERPAMTERPAMPESPQPAEDIPESGTDGDVVMSDPPPVQSNPGPAEAPSRGSSWAFWSRENPTSSRQAPRQQSGHGELAVSGERSESSPRSAESLEVDGRDSESENKPMGLPPPPVSDRMKNKKRVRPDSLDLDTPAPVTPKPDRKQGKPKKGSKQDAIRTPDASPAETPTKAKTPPAKDMNGAALPPNLLLPSFKSTYQMRDNPSIMQQIADFLLRTRQPPAKRVYRVKEVPTIKKALAIGIHGLFPASYLKPIIGHPTGTSLRFAGLCAEAIRRWADKNGQEDCVIERVALEWEGRISDRVNNLWTLLLNWIDQIRTADLIVVACHSQGVPVGVILLAKLIDLGIIKDAKIGVCAMAGVSLGPFPDYKSKLVMFMGAAAELWDLADPLSEVSLRYESALREVLEYGVRITFIGSIDDQLVPLESAVYSPANHPYIHRAVFIDGRIHASDFISHLVGFALKLRNLGVSDHGLIRELSMPLAGSLYGGEGHSRIYFDDQVYDLAIAHALETTDLPTRTPCTFHKPAGVSSPNPYHLPWVMRGLLEEDFVKTELWSETDELLRQFDEWKPGTKALRDVKYRLEAVRSKL